MSEQAPRNVHFVGTLPKRDNEAAMEYMLEEAGLHLATMPDGETNRLDYVTDLVKEFQDHPAVHHLFSKLHPGELKHFGDLPFDTLPDPSKLTQESLQDPEGYHLGYADEALASWPVFQRLKEEAIIAGNARPDLRFQVGIPGDLQIPFMAFKASGFKKSHRLPFMEATADEMRKIHEVVGDDGVFQLELPSENVLTAYAPRLARPEVARRFALGVRRLLLAGPEGAIVGVHLCNIDMNNKSLLPFISPNAFVMLGNALEEHWPHDHNPPMDFAHFPLARGGHAPRFDDELLDELGKLKLHPDTRKIMGMSQAEQGYEEQEQGLHAIEERIGAVGVAATCGYGRWRGEATRYDEFTGQPVEYDTTRVDTNVRHTIKLADS